MFKFFLSFLAILCALTLIVGDAQAKRFGGGRSFGVSRPVSSFTSAKNLVSPSTRATASRWMGPLAGMVAGGLLASLFMHNGLGSGMFAWVAIAGIVFLLFNLMRNRNQFTNARRPAFEPAANTYYQNNQASQFASSQASSFDADNFLRDAKVQFLRMQTAYDQKNLNDIRSFTTPEVFAEIQVQLQEMQDIENVTEVTTLNAELVNDANAEMASARFYGLVREKVNEAPVQFNETWHFQRMGEAGKWIVSGIQQN